MRRLEGTLRFSIGMYDGETVENAIDRMIEAWLCEFEKGDEIEFEDYDEKETQSDTNS